MSAKTHTFFKKWKSLASLLFPVPHHLVNCFYLFVRYIYIPLTVLWHTLLKKTVMLNAAKFANNPGKKYPVILAEA